MLGSAAELGAFCNLLGVAVLFLVVLYHLSAARARKKN